MDMTIVIVLVVVGFGFWVWSVWNDDTPTKDMQIVCPHCQTKGHVTTRQVQLKKGVSGGKAVGALLTGGVSLLAVGLSRKEDATKATCSNCGSVWHF